MNTSNNSIFLAYSQDAVQRLPNAIAQTFTSMGLDVYLDTKHFDRATSPSSRILTEIAHRGYYLILLTPASIRWGFDFGERRLQDEIQQANQSGCHFAILCGYGFTPQHTGVWWSHFGLPDSNHVRIITIDHQNILQSLEDFAGTLSGNTHAVAPLDATLIKQLDAEFALDQGLTEKYDAQRDNRKSTAIHNFNQALEIDPDYAAAYFHRAELFNFRSKMLADDRDKLFASALHDYNHAIELEPSNARHYIGRANLYRAAQELVKALENYTLAITYAPESARYYNARASIYQQLDQFDEAINDYTSAIQLQPEVSGYYYNRSGIYANQKDYQLAMQDLSQAIAKYPRHVPHQWYVLRGFLYRDLDLSEKAEMDWHQAVEVAYHQDAVHSFRAGVHIHRGELEEARSAAKSALAINPENRAAQGILKRLDKN